MKILLVDDSMTMRTIQKLCLNKIGFDNISEAIDGVMGFEMFQKENFDIILTDWNMPNMNGLEFLKSIRKINTQIPVIMVTTESEKERFVEAMKMGASDYLVKPFTPADLNKKIKRWTIVSI